MHWARWVSHNRTVGSVALATVLHFAVIAGVLVFDSARPAVTTPESLVIEFAEIELPPPEPIAPVEPVDETPPSPPERPPAEPATVPASTPQSAPSTQGTKTESPSVLTQNAPGETRLAESSGGDGTNTVSDAQITNVLKLFDCQKLRDHRGDDCPDADPFTAAAAAAERDTVKPKHWADSDFNKTVMEKFLDREANARFHWPDADLFADRMPPGAYNAQRIRDGREPLWSKKMRDGFRKNNADED